ncbi:MAG: FAD:protein FMN transferase, partial [Armatimonadetes bacterium]|nr:FAD:protein FMN transferase [Armatimonadota bacterium]
MVLGQVSAGAEPARFQYTEVHMGVQTRLVLRAPTAAKAERAAQAAFRRIEQLESAMSDYRASSELMRLCAGAGQGPVAVSRDLFRVLARCRQLSERSDGAFDATVGPVVGLWRKARKDGRLPPVADLEAARRLVGWREVELDAVRRTVSLKRPGMKLDLGGIAKGYACDAALAELRRLGLPRAMVEMGGDIAVGAPPPGRRGWRVAIPNASGPDAEQELANCAVSTSGDVEQFVEFAGVRYSHIVDPHTGLGLTTRIAVTVIAPSGELSDGLSTAISVLGPDAGRRLAQRYSGVRCYIRTQAPGASPVGETQLVAPASRGQQAQAAAPASRGQQAQAAAPASRGQQAQAVAPASR